MIFSLRRPFFLDKDEEKNNHFIRNSFNELLYFYYINGNQIKKLLVE